MTTVAALKALCRPYWDETVSQDPAGSSSSSLAIWKRTLRSPARRTDSARCPRRRRWATSNRCAYASGVPSAFTRGRADKFVLLCAQLYKVHVLDTLVDIAKDTAALQEKGLVMARGGHTVDEAMSIRYSRGITKFTDTILKSDGEHYSFHEEYTQSRHSSMFLIERLAFPENLEDNADGLRAYIADERKSPLGNTYYTMKPWFMNLCKDNVNDPGWMSGWDMVLAIQKEYQNNPSKSDFEGKML